MKHMQTATFTASNDFKLSLFVWFGLFSMLVEQAKEVSLYFQNNQVGAPTSTLSP